MMDFFSSNVSVKEALKYIKYSMHDLISNVINYCKAAMIWVRWVYNRNWKHEKIKDGNNIFTWIPI